MYATYISLIVWKYLLTFYKNLQNSLKFQIIQKKSA